MEFIQGVGEEFPLRDFTMAYVASLIRAINATSVDEIGNSINNIVECLGDLQNITYPKRLLIDVCLLEYLIHTYQRLSLPADVLIAVAQACMDTSNNMQCIIDTHTMKKNHFQTLLNAIRTNRSRVVIDKEVSLLCSFTADDHLMDAYYAEIGTTICEIVQRLPDAYLRSKIFSAIASSQLIRQITFHRHSKFFFSFVFEELRQPPPNAIDELCTLIVQYMRNGDYETLMVQDVLMPKLAENDYPPSICPIINAVVKATPAYLFNKKEKDLIRLRAGDTGGRWKEISLRVCGNARFKNKIGTIYDSNDTTWSPGVWFAHVVDS